MCCYSDDIRLAHLWNKTTKVSWRDKQLNTRWGPEVIQSPFSCRKCTALLSKQQSPNIYAGSYKAIKELECKWITGWKGTFCSDRAHPWRGKFVSMIHFLFQLTDKLPLIPFLSSQRKRNSIRRRRSLCFLPLTLLNLTSFCPTFSPPGWIFLTIRIDLMCSVQGLPYLQVLVVRNLMTFLAAKARTDFLP